MKIKFNPNPTFKALVLVPTPGYQDDLIPKNGEKEGSEIIFTFRHLKTSEIDKIHTKYQEEISGSTAQAETIKIMAAHILALADGWDVVDEQNDNEPVKMNAVNIAHMLAYYPGLYMAVLSTFAAEYWKAKAKI